MKKSIIIFSVLSVLTMLSCTKDDDGTTDSNTGGTTSTATDETYETPLSAFDEFNTSAATLTFGDDDVTIVTNALPNHTSPYWASTDSLYINAILATGSLSPGNIISGSYTLTVPKSPAIATTSSETGLGAIGISVTGVPIYNQSEGPTDVTESTATTFDWAGGHSGPTGYHYHIETREANQTNPLSLDDEKLVGILQDGFLLYGRKCNSTSSYPTDLDESGGHVSTSQHGVTEFYHYHIVNDLYLNAYYLLFGVDLKGVSNAIE
jgi:hypothetical protein